MKSKINMKNKIIIIALLILAFAMILSLTSSVQARGLEEAGKSISIHGDPNTTLKSWSIGTSKDIYTSALTGKDEAGNKYPCGEFIYCINLAKDFVTDGYGKANLTLEKIVTINDEEIKIESAGGKVETVTDAKTLGYAQGLAYLLNIEDNSGYPANGQIALWAYIDILGSNAEKVGMYEVDQGSKIGWNNESGSYVITKCNSDVTTLGETDLKKASTYLNNAMNIVNGKSEYIYNAKFYVFTNNGKTNQPVLMLHSSSTEDKIPGIKFNINKVDEKGAALEGAKFNITATQGKNTLINKSSTTDLTYTISSSSIKSTADITVVIEEAKAPDLYEIANGKLEFILKYDADNKKWIIKETKSNMDGLATNPSATKSGNNTIVTTTITNKKQNYFYFTIDKTSTIGTAVSLVQGTKFTMTTSNVEKIEINYKYTGITVAGVDTITLTPNGELGWDCTVGEKTITITDFIVMDGKIEFEKIYLKEIGENNPATITLEETDPATNHAKPDSAFKFDVTIQDGTVSVAKNGEQPVELTKLGVKDKTVTAKITNYGLIQEISGYVWLDGQTGIKNASERNGEFDADEEKLENILVYLYNKDGSLANTKEDNPQTTNAQGEYKFTEISYSEGMYLAFEYDGIRYIETNSMRKIEEGKTTDFDNTDSHAREESDKRTTLNEKYKTITSSTEGLTYSYDDTKATLTTTDMINAKKEITYSDKAIVINCGLVKRELDLELSNSLDTVSVEINGKTTDYSYSKDENGNVTLSLEEKKEQIEKEKENENGVTYNQYLYASDYNFSINDYIDHNGEDDIAEIQANNILNEDQELEVYVIYKIKLVNISTVDATVYQIDDYHSKYLTFVEVVDEKAMGADVTVDVDTAKVAQTYTVDGSDYYKTQIFFLTEEDGKVADTNNEIYLKYKVNNIKEYMTLENKDIANIAEISAYGTANGYIDIDSKPGNMVTDNQFRFEDDTDKSGILTITDAREERELSGVVWEENSEKNGVYDKGEELINGVTVQLIELKDYTVNGTTYHLEYIWQETTTGSGTVWNLSTDGYSINIVSNGGVTKGQYKFVGYIPGNYIVRFKYGTDTMLSNTATSKYDGNAYKSAYDKSEANRYQGNTDLTLLLNEGTRYSDAFDNEARRLEEMSIFGGDTITNVGVDDLQNHWMCADTNSFGLYVAQNNKNDSIDTTENKQTVNVNSSSTDTTYEITNLDFGLMERPETVITLEKHISGISIDVAGEGKILDARLKIDDWLNDVINGTEKSFDTYIEGTKDSLSVMKATRNDKGFWKFETDVADLMNGAELSVEYTYIVSNSGDQDYLSKQLVEAYQKLYAGESCTFTYENGETKTILPTTDYKALLTDIADQTKTNIRSNNHTNGYYIGTFYYTGNKGNVEGLPEMSLVSVKIDKIEQLIDTTDFVFDEKINYSSYGQNENYFSQYADRKEIPTAITKEHGNYYYYYENYKKTEYNSNYIIVQSKGGKSYLVPDEYDTTKKMVLTKTLNTSNVNNLSFDSTIGEILSYSVASGRRDTKSTPGNLSYSYSADEDITLESYIKIDGDSIAVSAIEETGYSKANESDEFWGETIIITSPTGEDNNSVVMWTILGTICAVIIAGGIFTIKKFVLKH